LQAYRQQLQAVEQACESALSQVAQALMMLDHVDPSQVATFQAAVAAKFGRDTIGLLEPAPTEPDAPAPEPITPDAPVGDGV
jgi:hypothetical protein